MHDTVVSVSDSSPVGQIVSIQQVEYQSAKSLTATSNEPYRPGSPQLSDMLNAPFDVYRGAFFVADEIVLHSHAISFGRQCGPQAAPRKQKEIERLKRTRKDTYFFFKKLGRALKYFLCCKVGGGHGLNTAFDPILARLTTCSGDLQ